MADSQEGVDALIAKHAQRIASHRKNLLEGVAPTLDTDPNPSGQQPAGRLSMRAAGSATASPQRHHAPHTNYSPARHQAAGPRLSQHSQQRPASSARRYPAVNGSSGDPFQLASSSSSSPFVDRDAADDDYKTRTPGRMYERSQRWAQSRNAAVERQRREAAERQHDECTFSPKLVTAQNNNSHHQLPQQTPTSNGGGVAAVGQSYGAAARGAAAAHIGSPTVYSNNNTGGGGGGDRTARHKPLTAADTLPSGGSSDGQQPLAVPDTPSVYLHVQRQEEARREKEARQRKAIGVDIDNWRPRTTVPKEFSFANRAENIPSLRKPVLYRRMPSSGASSSGGGYAENHHRSASAPPTAANNENEDDREYAPREEGDSMSAPASPSGTRRGGRRQQQQHQDQAGVPFTLDDAMRHMESQDREIAKLHGVVASLQRELEVAKGKVTQLTLGQPNQFL